MKADIVIELRDPDGGVVGFYATAKFLLSYSSLVIWDDRVFIYDWDQTEKKDHRIFREQRAFIIPVKKLLEKDPTQMMERLTDG